MKKKNERSYRWSEPRLRDEWVASQKKIDELYDQLTRARHKIHAQRKELRSLHRKWETLRHAVKVANQTEVSIDPRYLEVRL